MLPGSFFTSTARELEALFPGLLRASGDDPAGTPENRGSRRTGLPGPFPGLPVQHADTRGPVFRLRQTSDYLPAVGGGAGDGMSARLQAGSVADAAGGHRDRQRCPEGGRPEVIGEDIRQIHAANPTGREATFRILESQATEEGIKVPDTRSRLLD
jgi:hypothetical protein